MRLTVIGCSGSLPGPASAASCYLVEAEDRGGRTWRIVLDLGNGALGPLQARTRLTDVDAVLLSHLHADHCLDLCGYYVALKYDPNGGAGRRVPVHGPRGTAERMARAYDLPSSPGMGSEFEFLTLYDGVPLYLGPLEVTPHRVVHPVEAYAFRVVGPGEDDAGARTLVYTGDTDSCGGVEIAAAGADLLLAEAAFEEGRDIERGIHLTGRRAGELATTAGVRKLVLTHLPPWNDAATALRHARAAYSGDVQLARPGAVHLL